MPKIFLNRPYCMATGEELHHHCPCFAIYYEHSLGMQEGTAHFFFFHKIASIILQIFQWCLFNIQKYWVCTHTVLYLVVLHTFAFQASKQKDFHHSFAMDILTLTELTVLWFRHHWQTGMTEISSLCKPCKLALSHILSGTNALSQNHHIHVWAGTIQN